MMQKNIFSQAVLYLFWLCWSIVVGGVLSVALLAPLAFHHLPGYFPDPVQAIHFSQKLLTLFFTRFLPICAFAFGLMTVIEHLSFKQERKVLGKPALLFKEILLIAGNLIWLSLALSLVPQMEELVLGNQGQNWLNEASREAFKPLHVWSTRLTQIGFLITLLLGWYPLKRSLPHTQATQK